MKLRDLLPAPVDLIAKENHVLEFLMNNPYIKEKHPQFARHASAFHQRGRQAGAGFTFSSHLDLLHMPKHAQAVATRRGKAILPNYRMLVASTVELRSKSEYGNISHCLGVFRLKRDGQVSVLRKFHFDTTIEATAEEKRSQPHPRFHLQYCGDMVPYMAKDLNVRRAQLDQLHPWLSEPRVFYMPMSLALLLDMLLREFPDPDSRKFRATSEWSGIVREREAALLLPFFKECGKVIEGSGKMKGPGRTLADQFSVG